MYWLRVFGLFLHFHGVSLQIYIFHCDLLLTVRHWGRMLLSEWVRGGGTHLLYAGVNYLTWDVELSGAIDYLPLAKKTMVKYNYNHKPRCESNSLCILKWQVNLANGPFITICCLNIWHIITAQLPDNSLTFVFFYVHPSVSFSEIEILCPMLITQTLLSDLSKVMHMRKGDSWLVVGLLGGFWLVIGLEIWTWPGFIRLQFKLLKDKPSSTKMVTGIPVVGGFWF
jgi:hypothetical protein